MVGAVAAALVVLAVSAPSQAGIDPNPTPNPDPDPVSQSQGATDSGGTATADSGGCHLVSTPQSLGSYCPGGESDTASIKAIMGKEKFKKCWDDPMSAEDQALTGYYDAPDEVPPRWGYWERCLMGIDDDLTVHPPIYLRQTAEYIYDQSKIRRIGDNERKLLVFTNHTIPYPVAVVSPTTSPRVNQWLSFFDGQPAKDVDGVTEHQVTVTALGQTLVAKEEKIVVRPRGTNDDDSISCPGSGHKAVAGETPVAGGNCWYRYPRSSAGQPDDKYPVRITAYWTVYLNGARFNSFQKSTTANIPVTEIQAINVS
ncbi:hypothetical protein D9V37_17195 [Nocardioides mangrovicus]|uniref:Secreted protein n=1 Tax=Nocardioides mangrovicus TaxID=2478913 RepID=A0A3L8NZ61_9ACTN|nr:hypothetical protein D9V37_17195 [Nocardioides mangrovicus]